MKEHIESVGDAGRRAVRALERPACAARCSASRPAPGTAAARSATGSAPAGRAHPAGSTSCATSCSRTPTRLAPRAAGIAALLKADLFREGIDGEAVRLGLPPHGARAETRRLLLVVSDGCPMDTATNLANDAHYLDQHLREVSRARAGGPRAIFGVGVGLDLSPYYSRSRRWTSRPRPATACFRELLEMIAGRGRR
jgi:cobaltochelatase CobT